MVMALYYNVLAKGASVLLSSRHGSIVLFYSLPERPIMLVYCHRETQIVGGYEWSLWYKARVRPVEKSDWQHRKVESTISPRDQH